MQITYTKRVRLLREVTVAEQALVQKIVAMVEEAYLADICKCTTNSINDAVEYVLTLFQEKYGQLMPRKLLQRNVIVNKTIYNTRYQISTIFSAVDEPLKLSNITGTLYTKDQASNIAYITIHRTGKFGLAIRKWNCTTTVQRAWVGFKQYF